MIFGIGTDILEIGRVEEILGKKLKNRFMEKYFTPEERAYFQTKRRPAESVCGAFAAKEAFSKALGTGARGFSLADVEIFRDSLGKPEIRLYGAALKIAEARGAGEIFVTISHSKTAAAAFVLIMKRENDSRKGE